MKIPEFRYFRPASVTWWSGALSIALGVAAILLPESGAVSQLGQVVAVLTGGGDASPAGLIALGAGLIGLRDALARGA